MTKSVRAFAPASVSNIACGFDILGFALQSEGDGRLGPGDVVTAREREPTASGQGPVRITAIAGDEGRLPLEAQRNTAAVAAKALVDDEAPGAAVDLEIEKRMPLESGLGSSAASAVAAVVSVDALLRLELPAAALLRYAVAGEVLASGGAHADNLAPSLLGGLVLVRSLDPEPDVIDLPVPEGLTCALVRPHAEVNTKESRARLDRLLPLERAVTQWGNAAALVAALYRSDLELLSRALVDVVAEPVRAPAVPGFHAAKAAAIEAGALGCSLSGSGPALFALCDGPAGARQVAAAMAGAFESSAGVDCDRLVAPLPAPGARVIDGEA
ncbi:MAG: homoserine kinase [Holophagales bacterium]|nr:homoserine kinase [Holophagales bacterium]MYG32130.1 homoserine kinase [Holophagales bacterium]MYI80262.1 homoserine kinase [Holophagales bacterium]